MAEAHRMTNASPIAIVTPVLDDAAALRRLLTRIGAWFCRPAEIRVVAASPAPAIDAVCREAGCDLTVARSCRGEQLDIGARATRADIIWFLHADAVPAESSIAAIESARAAGAESGCFRFEFTARPSWPKRIVAAGVAMRLRCGGIPYGDQGLWMTRAAYEACGGFVHQPLFEEVRLVQQLRKRGTFVVLNEAIGVSPRRWERDGWLRRCAANRMLALGYAIRISPARLAARYYRPRLVEGRSQ
jgi:hypothetical protein